MNDFLMQFQCDVLGRDVVVPTVKETTARGAAFAAGLAVGVWENLEELRGLWEEEKRYSPRMREIDRERYLRGWNRAVERSLGWVEEEGAYDNGEEEEENNEMKEREKEEREEEEEEKKGTDVDDDGGRGMGGASAMVSPNEKNAAATVITGMIATAALILGFVVVRSRKMQ